MEWFEDIGETEKISFFEEDEELSDDEITMRESAFLRGYEEDTYAFDYIDDEEF
ncbi:hypothetical protein HYU11_01875 [Candidatus Woesearchaeota archaeon]|nr:hypothetical protein [Candidatus Woesearchaeota archaeon]